MRKKVLTRLFAGGLLAIIAVIALLVYENNRSLTGLAALESVGRFVIYAAILLVLLICLLVTLFFLKRK